MNWWIVVVGLLVGPVINLAIYSLAYFPRPISPWQRKGFKPGSLDSDLVPGKPSVLAFVPILGWLTRWNERPEFGNWFWLRPLCIEVATPIALVWLYEYVLSGGLLPETLSLQASQIPFSSFVFATALAVLLTVATFIDFDERTIPDAITVPGTIFALLGGTFFPTWRLQEYDPDNSNVLRLVHPNSPYGEFSSEWIQGAQTGLWLAIIFWIGWCFALMDRVLITRRGWSKAMVYFAEILRRSPTTVPKIGLMIVGVILVAIAYSYASPEGWEGLFSGLFGMAMGGGLVWSFRIVASLVMGREALGFGDVTLMAMVGAFTGWQAVWIGFFLAPMFGLVFVIAIYLVTKDSSTPFGPYLAMSVLYTLLTWKTTWPSLSSIFFEPTLMLALLVGLLGTLAVALIFVLYLKSFLTGGETEAK